MQDLFERAKAVTLEELPIFIKEISNLSPTSLEKAAYLAAACMATLSALSKSFQPKKDVTLSAVRLLIDNLADEGDPQFAKIAKMDKVLNTGEPTGYISLTPEAFIMLQKEAQQLLDTADAADHMKLYWESIVKGKVPLGFTVVDSKDN